MIADDYCTDCPCEICAGQDSVPAEAFGRWDGDDQEVTDQ